MKNLMVWARKYVEYEGFNAMSSYIRGNATFAEAAIDTMEGLIENLKIKDERIYDLGVLVKRDGHLTPVDMDEFADRYKSGEDPEAILRDILGLASNNTLSPGTPASPPTKL